ncbi:MAG: hypothetical protein AB7P76_09445 [Candidatus Melainabacteria bacterium]
MLLSLFSALPNHRSDRALVRPAAVALSLALTLSMVAPGVWARDLGGTLTALENQFFGAAYTLESAEARLTRIERYVYGEEHGGSVSDRIEPLSSLVVQGAPASAQAPSPGQPAAVPAPPPRKDATDYPTITAMEMKLFNRNFVQEDITFRLNRLEARVFGRPTGELALVDRVDRLDARVNRVTPYTPPAASRPVAHASAISSLPENSSEFVGSPDTYTKLSSLEKTLLNGRTNDGMLITERLDILEREMLGYTKAGESVDTRLNRLLRGYQSRAGTPYNRPYVPYSAYSQGYVPDTDSAGYPGAGAVANPAVVTRSTTTYANPFTGSQTTVHRQNIQIGAGMSSISSYNYSPELVQMLPPAARQQMQGNTTTHTGSYAGSTGYAGAPPAYAPPSSGGLFAAPIEEPDNPALVPDLEDMEYRMFGGVYNAEKMVRRVERLEVALTGKPNPSLPMEVRVSNLLKVVQYQSLANVLDQNRQRLKNIEGVKLRPQPEPTLGIPLGN